MDTACPSCVLANVAGRTICKGCGAALFPDMPAQPVTVNPAYMRRVLFTLIGAVVAPVVLLSIVTLIDKFSEGFSMSPDVSLLVMVVFFALGLAFVFTLPVSLWARVVLCIAYVPILFVVYLGSIIILGCAVMDRCMSL